MRLSRFLQNSARGPAAVDDEDLPGAVRRGVRGEEEQGAVQLVLRAAAAEHRVPVDPVARPGVGEQLVGHLRPEPAGGERVDAHAPAPPLARELPGQADEAGLGRGIAGTAQRGGGDQAEYRGHVDHRGSPPLAGRRGGQAGKVERCDQVHLEHIGDSGRVFFESPRRAARSGVVDQHVQTAPCGQHRLDETDAVAVAADVAGHRMDAPVLGGQRLEPVQPARGRVDGGAGRGEHPDEPRPESRRGTGHDGDAAIEAEQVGGRPHRRRRGGGHGCTPIGTARAPPSMTSVWPVIQDDLSLARNTAASATSSGVPSLRVGSCAVSTLSRASQTARARSVLITPGAIALTRTFGPSSYANCRVRWIMAAFVALYQPMPGSTIRPPTEAMLTTAPPRSAIDARQAQRVHASMPNWLTRTVFSARGRSRSMRSPMYGLVAALLTRTSSRPSRSVVSATHRSAWSGSPALATMARTSASPARSSSRSRASRSPSGLRAAITTCAPSAR